MMSTAPVLPQIPSINIFLDSGLIPAFEPDQTLQRKALTATAQKSSESQPIKPVLIPSPNRSIQQSSSSLELPINGFQVGQTIPSKPSNKRNNSYAGVDIDTGSRQGKTARDVMQATGNGARRVSKKLDEIKFKALQRLTALPEQPLQEIKVKTPYVQPIPRTPRKTRNGHGRTASESSITSQSSAPPSITTSTHTKHRKSHHGRSSSSSSSPPQLHALREHSRSTSLDITSTSPAGKQGIILGTKKDFPVVQKLLIKMTAMIPPSRLPETLMPPTSGILIPQYLLIPLAYILEALVVERSVLQGTNPATLLPVLRDGRSLQSDSPDSELDWNGMRKYILGLGKLLDAIMGHLTTSTQEEEISALIAQMRMYVIKMKKVFGEVATMYVDGYGFMRGLWEEDGMKACAGEIGRWAEQLDA